MFKLVQRQFVFYMFTHTHTERERERVSISSLSFFFSLFSLLSSSISLLNADGSLPQSFFLLVSLFFIVFLLVSLFFIVFLSFCQKYTSGEPLIEGVQEETWVKNHLISPLWRWRSSGSAPSPPPVCGAEPRARDHSWGPDWRSTIKSKACGPAASTTTWIYDCITTALLSSVYSQ